MARSARGTAAASSGGGRRTIAFLSASVHVGAGRSLWPGVADGAELQDVNLICFPGGRLGAPQDFEAQRNNVYDLVGAETVDGIISWASTLTGSASYEEVAAFHRRLAPLPLVSLALPLAGVPALLVDSYLGMRAAVEHLILAHGRRRPAFLRGPKNHYYAQQRYAAYSDALRAHGIPLDPRLVTDPFRWEMGAEAAEQLLGERGLEPGADFDAVVASSDLMALDALAVLEGRGIRVPEEVALVGFNDSDEGRMATPPLTSVSPPFYEQGRRAVDLLLSQLSGAVQPLETVLDTRLTIRESCGCPSRAVILAGGESPDPEERTRQRRPARAEMPGAIAGAIGDTSTGGVRCAALVYDSFLNDVTGATPGAFLPALSEALRDTAARGPRSGRLAGRDLRPLARSCPARRRGSRAARRGALPTGARSDRRGCAAYAGIPAGTSRATGGKTARDRASTGHGIRDRLSRRPHGQQAPGAGDCLWLSGALRGANRITRVGAPRRGVQRARPFRSATGRQKISLATTGASWLAAARPPLQPDGRAALFPRRVHRLYVPGDRAPRWERVRGTARVDRQRTQGCAVVRRSTGSPRRRGEG